MNFFQNNTRACSEVSGIKPMRLQCRNTAALRAFAFFSDKMVSGM